MQAMTFMAPPHFRQSMSILNTPFNLCAQVIAARRLVLRLIGRFEHAAFTPLGERHQSTVLAIGANTPWKRVRLTLGFGTRTASLAMKSSRLKITCVVPSRYCVFS